MKIYRRICIITGAVFLVWFLAPALFSGVFNAGNMIGIPLSGIILLCGIFMNKTHLFLKKLWEKAFGKVFLSFLSIAVAVVVGFVLFVTGNIIFYANNTPPTDNTTVVVLGCQVKPWGPSLMLRQRIDAAYKYLEKHENVKCVLSGGQGDDEPVSEAECMYNELVSRGIDPDRLYIENKSTSTRENLLFSMEVIKKNNLSQTVTIVTNDFHQYRASIIAKSLDITNYNVSGKTLPYLFPTYFVREIGGVLFEIVVD
ncbi:MAG: YdcF family protein [Clostridia bacterium]|nr:YdcF family protein [Clostridia bacterium]